MDPAQRAGILRKKLGKTKAWCREFLDDLGPFSAFLARHFRVDVTRTDRALARAVEKQRCSEDSSGVSERYLAKRMAGVTVDLDPPPQQEVTEEELAKIFG